MVAAIRGAVSNPRVLAVVGAVAATIWPSRYRDKLLASLTPARTLEELQKAVDTPAPDTEIRHIVEEQDESKHPLANAKRFPDKINAPENLVRVPYWAHREISRWYSRVNTDQPFNGQTPRNWLRGKSWEEQYEVGLMILRKFGVLK
jgi:hypothetical protein